MTTQTTSGYWTPFGALLIGAVAGGIAAVLLAPCAGAETRRRIKGGFLEGKSAAARRSQELAANIVDRGEQLVDAGKKKVTDEVHRIDSALQAGKTAYRQTAAAEA